MKIEKTSKPLPLHPLAEGMTRAASEKTGEGMSPISSTNVHLGHTAAQLSNLESSMASVPLVDAAKVEQIKQAISEGRFQVNPAMVADRLIQTVTELINSNSQAS